MQSELSAELAIKAKATLAEEAVRTGMRSGLAGIGQSFCRVALGADPASVVVRFTGDVK